MAPQGLQADVQLAPLQGRRQGQTQDRHVEQLSNTDYSRSRMQSAHATKPAAQPYVFGHHGGPMHSVYCHVLLNAITARLNSGRVLGTRSKPLLLATCTVRCCAPAHHDVLGLVCCWLLGQQLGRVAVAGQSPQAHLVQLLLRERGVDIALPHAHGVGGLGTN